MKIKTVTSSLENVNELPFGAHISPKKQSAFFRWLIKQLSKGELKKVDFSYEMIGMDKLDKGCPCLYLMNHSCFTDLMIAGTILYPNPYHIVCTSDGFVGKGKLMRKVGCIPTHKFVMDTTLVKDMIYATRELKSSVLMYPEASYSFDGTATPLPDSLGKLIKMLKVPVVMIKTYGAFQRDPLYNNLQVRKSKISADVKLLLTLEDIAKKSAEDILELVKNEFSFDNFAWQKEESVIIDEDFRADFLNRVLYKCPSCKKEGYMEGKGIHLTCKACDKKWEMKEDGSMLALAGETEFSHIPNWYKWERECVRAEIENDSYKLEVPVNIGIIKDEKAVYMVGEGILKHDKEGFHLTGCDGKLDYKQSVKASYSLYADYYWYEIGDMICVGDMKNLYYCFPKNSGDVVAKTRLAAEELFKMV